MARDSDGRDPRAALALACDEWSRLLTGGGWTLAADVLRRAMLDINASVPVFVLLDRLQARAAMNRRTAETHPDPETRTRAAGRAEGYEMAAWELTGLAGLRGPGAPRNGPADASGPSGRADPLPTAPAVPSASSGPGSDDQKALFDRPTVNRPSGRLLYCDTPGCHVTGRLGDVCPVCDLPFVVR